HATLGEGETPPRRQAEIGMASEIPACHHRCSWLARACRGRPPNHPPSIEIFHVCGTGTMGIGEVRFVGVAFVENFRTELAVSRLVINSSLRTTRCDRCIHRDAVNICHVRRVWIPVITDLAAVW